MNRLFYLIFVFLFSTLGLYPYAQILVQNGENVKLYSISELQMALDSAESGSVVYIPGGFTFSGNYNIKKKLFIIGAGAFINGTPATGVSDVDTFTFLSGSDSSTVEGINTSIYISKTASNSVSDILLKRLKINELRISEGDTTNNITLKDCVILFNISNVIANKTKNVSFYNCIFDKSINTVYSYCLKSAFNTSFINCVFHMKTTTTSAMFQASSNSANNLFENCIFRSHVVLSSLGRLNIFTNCLITYNQTDWGTENMAIDCLVNQNKDSIFTYLNNADNFYSEDNDYNLINSCLGKNYGTDGTDLGIYGGSSPFKDNGIPSNPHFLEFSPSLKAKDGYLEVDIKVEAQTK